jgi:antitoxin (DNA-binding transcriptional repressor) of toxin-antitoxin stability system
MSNMSKQVSSREFFHNFSKLHNAMEPGETLVITKHGKPLGDFRKPSQKRAFNLPDFKALGLKPRTSMAARDVLYRKLLLQSAGDAFSLSRMGSIGPGAAK